MMNSRSCAIAAAVCAALLVAGPADAKKRKPAPAKAAACPVAATQAPSLDGMSMGLSSGMAGMPDGGPMILQYFDQIDVDRNGQLSRAEITAFMERVRQLVWQRVEEKFNAADADASGSLTPEEAAAMPVLAKHFDFVDANDDHLVDLAEIRNSLDPATIRAQIAARLKAADTDHDGRISLAEAQASLPRIYAHFEQLDANGDGYLTIEDFQQLSMFPG